MLAQVTKCPFENTDQLAQCADIGKLSLEQKILDIQATLAKSHPSIIKQLTQMDDLYLAAITAAQNTTLRCTVCTFCDNAGCSCPTA